MLLMLTATHDLLVRRLQAVHAAQLQTAELKLQQMTEKLRDSQQTNQYLTVQVRVLTEAIVSQQQTIRTAMSDLVILKGAGRVRSEPDKPPDPRELRPDVEITGEPTDLADRRDLIRQAREEYEAALRKLEEEVDTSKVTQADIEAAIPATAEDWEREHAQPTDPDDRVLVAGL